MMLLIIRILYYKNKYIKKKHTKKRYYLINCILTNRNWKMLEIHIFLQKPLQTTDMMSDYW